MTVRWHGELDFDATDAAGAIVPMSSKENVFGPSLIVLAALGGCTGMDAISVMRKKKVAVDSYRVEISGEQREACPKAHTSIVVEGRRAQPLRARLSLGLTSARSADPRHPRAAAR